MAEGSSIPSSLESVETPVGLIDLRRVRANAERVARYCAEHDIKWRPHTKTHKTPEVARIECEAGARGLTVATPREAEVMATVCRDLLLAYPVVGAQKLARLMALDPSVKLSVALDSETVLDSLAQAAAAHQRQVDVLIELDLGSRRVGLETPEQLLKLARRTQELAGTRFSGVMFHVGHIGTGSNYDALIAQVASDLQRFLDALDAAGLRAEVVSGGNTPALWRSHEIPHLNEMRAGTYIFNDRDSVASGAATWNDVAYSVLATVVSVSVSGQAVIDAGSKALAKEALGHARGYGVVLGEDDAVVSGLSEEHGVIDLTTTSFRPKVGDRVRIVPNHVCVSVNLQDVLLAVDGTTHHTWPVLARGREAFRAGLR
jgi:D-serine deaminase-like pyridoxal phosphate-dependent protein